MKLKTAISKPRRGIGAADCLANIRGGLHPTTTTVALTGLVAKLAIEEQGTGIVLTVPPLYLVYFYREIFGSVIGLV